MKVPDLVFNKIINTGIIESEKDDVILLAILKKELSGYISKATVLEWINGDKGEHTSLCIRKSDLTKFIEEYKP